VKQHPLGLFSEKWALITGATSGIGEAISVILEKLLDMKNKFIKIYHIQVEIVPIDLSDVTSSERIFNFCMDHKINISILINNAGYALKTQDEMMYPEKVTAMLQGMVVSLTELCYRFGFSMKEAKKGWILNVSSIAGCIPVASTLTYCASKRYIIDYSKYLHYELKDDNIAVTCLMPGPTITNFSTNNSLPIPKKLLIFYQTAEQVALKGLIALANNKIIVITGGISKALIWFSRIIPPVITYKIQKNLWVKRRDRYC
jgi:short-subunit dehydrogenase